MVKPEMPFTDIKKLMEQFKQFQMPGLDIGAVVEARRKDVEALTEANMLAFEGLQALAERQADILKQAMSEWQSAASGLQVKNPAEIQAKQAELAKRAIETALLNMRELADLATKSQAKAFEVITKRANENIEDMKKALQAK